MKVLVLGTGKMGYGLLKDLTAQGPLDGLILDVRMNGGGSSLVTDPVMSFFASGKLGEFVSRDGSRSLSVEPNPVQNSQTVPLVVVVSQETVSYGEIFAGIMDNLMNNVPNVDKAIIALKDFDRKADPLRELAKYIINRVH